MSSEVGSCLLSGLGTSEAAADEFASIKRGELIAMSGGGFDDDEQRSCTLSKQG